MTEVADTQPVSVINELHWCDSLVFAAWRKFDIDITK